MTAVIVLLVASWLCWVVHRFRLANQRINQILDDFDRTHPVREPGRDEL